MMDNLQVLVQRSWGPSYFENLVVPPECCSSPLCNKLMLTYAALATRFDLVAFAHQLDALSCMTGCKHLAIAWTVALPRFQHHI